MRGPYCSLGREAVPLVLLIALTAGTWSFQTGPVARVAQSALLPARVPYRMESGIPVVEAQIGSGAVLRAALDTGLGPSILSEEEAAKRGITGGSPVTIATPLGPIRGVMTAPVSVRIGRVQLDGVPMAIANYPPGIAQERRAQVPSLWLGCSALAACIVLIDPDSGSVTWLSNDSGMPRAARLLPVSLSSGRMESQCRVGKAAVRPWILSTGTPGTVVPSDTIKALNLPVAGEKEVIGPSGETLRVGVVQLEEIVVGTVRIGGVRAVSVVSGSDGTPGVVGCDLLLRHKLYVAVGKNLLGLVPRKGVPKADSSHRVAVVQEDCAQEL